MEKNEYIKLKQILNEIVENNNNKYILLSIKSIYAEKIYKGIKKYEFRKKDFKKDIKIILLYETKPIGLITGCMKYDKILKDTPEKLWNKCFKLSGINEKDYFKYFINKNCAYAINIIETKKFAIPINPNDFVEKFTSPQSYFYI